MRTYTLALPTFFTPAKIPAPNPIVPNVPTVSTMDSNKLRILVPPSIINLIRSLSIIVCDNDSNEALKVLICQFVN